MIKLISFIISAVLSFLSVFGISFEYSDKIYTKSLIFTVENKTDIFRPGEDVWNNGAQYPTVICLEGKNGEDTLLASFEVFDKGETCFRIMRSNDSGDTWSEISRVTEKLDPSLNAAWNPCLYELPCAVGAFPAGTVLLAGVSVDPAHEKKSQISLFASSDRGETWSEISVIDSAGGIGEGVWEPQLIFDNGFLYCFYSDDSDEVYSQTIVLKKSADLVSWGEKLPVVIPSSPDDRPGMPVVTKLGNNGFFLCYEYGSGGEYPIYCKTSDSLENWEGDGKQVLTKGGDSLGSAPFCLWLTDGREDGTLIVSGKYGSRKSNDLFVSFDRGRSFTAMSNPLDYTDKPGFGYHPCLCASGDTLYYANCVDYMGELSKIFFVRMAPKPNPVRTVLG